MQAAERGVKRIRVHTLTDGRDCEDGTSVPLMETLCKDLQALGEKGVDARVASGGGAHVHHDGQIRGRLLPCAQILCRTAFILLLTAYQYLPHAARLSNKLFSPLVIWQTPFVTMGCQKVSAGGLQGERQK